MAWEQLLSIAQEARELREAEEAEGPVACPLCGEPFDENSAGVKRCSFDGYQPG